jgi:predicted membrane protein
MATQAPTWHFNLWSLSVGLFIALGGSVYPFAFAHADGTANHWLAMLAFWAMSAGLVHGVGFMPRNRVARSLFSGWACLLALALAVALKLHSGS